MEPIVLGEEDDLDPLPLTKGKVLQDDASWIIDGDVRAIGVAGLQGCSPWVVLALLSGSCEPPLSELLIAAATALSVPDVRDRVKK